MKTKLTFAILLIAVIGSMGAMKIATTKNELKAPINSNKIGLQSPAGGLLSEEH